MNDETPKIEPYRHIDGDAGEHIWQYLKENIVPLLPYDNARDILNFHHFQDADTNLTLSLISFEPALDYFSDELLDDLEYFFENYSNWPDKADEVRFYKNERLQAS